MKKTIDNEYAVTARKLLTKAGLGREKYFLYEGAMDTSLTGQLYEEPLFKGFKEGVSLPLLLCRGTAPGALIAADKAGREALAALKEQKKLPELTRFDFSSLLAPGYLEEMGPGHIQRRYFKNLGIDSSGEGYQALVDSALEDVRASLPEMFTGIPEAYRFTTVPLLNAFWGLGISADPYRLLRSRHLLYPKAVSPTPFGRQCGLVVRLSLRKDGSVRRELRVVKEALRAFWEAVSFKRTLHLDPGTGRLQDRLERLDNWQTSTYRTQREILPKLLASLRKVMDTGMGAIMDDMRSAEEGEAMDRLAREAELTEDMSFGEAMKQLAREVYTQDELDCVPSEYGDVWEALDGVGEMMRTRGVAKPLSRVGPPGEAPLPERLEGLGYALLPLQDMSLSHYLLAAATACDSSFPMWICHRLGLYEILRDCWARPFTTVGKTVRLVRWKDEKMLLYALIVRPIAEIFDAENTTMKDK